MVRQSGDQVVPSAGRGRFKLNGRAHQLASARKKWYSLKTVGQMRAGHLTGRANPVRSLVDHPVFGGVESTGMAQERPR